MSGFLGIHLQSPIISSEEHDRIKAALAAIGHEAVTFGMSEADKLVQATKAQYPALVTDIQGLISTVGSSALTPEEKLFSVASNLITMLPDALKALPSVKTFAVSLAQSVFADTVAELEHAAGAALAAILPK